MPRWVPLLGAVVSAAGFASQKPASPPATGLILGRVVDAGTGTGIPDAVVTLRPSSGTARETLTTTDGLFVFRQIARGSYDVSTAKNGYVPGRLGAGRPGSVGHLLEIGDAERIGDLTVRLWRLGAIEGAVYDEAGDPLVSVAVTAWKRAVVAGRPALEPRGVEARTDDRGIYRFSGLTPGQYVVGVVSTHSIAPAAIVEATTNDPDGAIARATSRGSLPTLPGTSMAIRSGGFIRAIASGRPIGPPIAEGDPALVYATTFHPATPALARTDVVMVQSGDERAGIDLRLKPIAAVSLSGRLTGPPDAIAYMPMSLLPRSADDRILDAPVATTVSDATGAFTFLGVPRGDYVVRSLRVPQLPDEHISRVVETPAGTASFVTTRPADGVSPEGTWWASVSTTVGDRDVPELVIPLSPGVRLRGRVAFDGATDRLEPGRWLFVEAADGERFVSRFSGDFSAWVSGTGEFLTPELPPGRYVVRFFPGRRWTLSTVTANGRDVADGIEIGSDPAPELLVRLSDSPSRVSGTIRNSRSGGDVDATVLAFPLDRRLWTGYGETPWRLQIVRTDRRGAYALTGLPAGTYAIVAVPDAQTADWPAPEFLARLAPVATRVEIAAGEQKTLDLQSVVVR